ncbi:MAG: 50S ribosomal protein L29 [Myxococcaceae bacterium]|nr:50S ribosomal protein L29 [Myxococcaceae bacterium]
MATARELRELSIEDLKRRAEETRATLFQDRMKMRTGTLDNPHERTAHKRELARILGVLTEKERAARAAR